MGIILKEGNKWLGTLEDFKRFLVGKIRYAFESNTKLKQYDFAVCDLPDYAITVEIGAENNIVSCMYNNATEWHGVKELQSPFDNSTSERQFISDLYGGGYFDCISLWADEIILEEIKKGVDNLFKNKDINETDPILWEECEEEDNGTGN